MNNKMSEFNLRPESFYSIDKNMTRSKLKKAYENNLTITGFVESFDFENSGCFKVDLGGNFIGIMPAADATIYSIYGLTGAFSGEFKNLVGRTIRIKVLWVSDSEDDPYVYVSREKNMLEALEHLQNFSTFTNAEIIAFSKHTAIIDVGQGILGRIFPRDFCHCRFDDIQDVGLKVGETIPVKVLSFDKKISKFVLSRVACLPHPKEALEVGNIYLARISAYAPKSCYYKHSYFVCIKGYISGILDTPYNFEKNDWILVEITKHKSKGPKLRLISRL